MDNTGHMIQMGVSLSIVYRIACQILPTLLPLIDSGGNWFGIVVLRLLDLFVMLEFSIVSLDGIFIVVLPVWLELEDVEMMDAPTKSLVTEEIVLHVPPEGNSPNTI